jgi:hypothetical protein
MRLQGDTLFIDPTTEQTDLKEIHQFLLENYRDIKFIKLDNDSAIVSSGLISLLISLKITDDNITIEFLDRNKEISLVGLGNLEIKY